MIKSKKLSKFKNVKHGFLNSLMKESHGIYKSINYETHSSKSKKLISKNLSNVALKIKSNTNKIILLNQIHSNKFYYIDKKSNHNNKKFKGDALITNKRNTPIAILTADCAPILIFDKKKEVAAAIHAGWKGAYKGILNKVIKFMVKKGSTVDNITAVIGPCISIKNYEVKKDFIKRFITKDIKNKVFFKKVKNKSYFNLNRYIAYQLKILGIKKIEVINKDTFNIKNNFFSARRSKSNNEDNYGRNISVIMIK